MRLLSDVISCNPNQADAAIVVERSLNNQQLIASFAPTKATVKVLSHLQQAVLPQAPQEARAINLFGSYGSGKSHLAVVIAQLMRDGCHSVEFTGLLERLTHFGQGKLAQDLKYTFKAVDHPDARPYLLVSLYGSETPSLGAKLIEGLYDALNRHPELSPETILPTTEYEVCAKQFQHIVSNSPSYANADLSQWQLADDYLTTAEMFNGLTAHQASALETFKAWHQKVCHIAFNPKHHGGHSFIEAYLEAGKNLADKHQFGGIVVIWDELGYALEELISNPQRHILEEIMDLQRFVETVCKPALGHTVFIGLTHKSFPQYASDVGANEAIKNRLETIEGRFAKAFKIELSAAESEGYHLLGMQKSWTETGLQLKQSQTQGFQQVLHICQDLPLFKSIRPHLNDVLNDCYPLHPIMAAGLFALSSYAQSNRTALTFFREKSQDFLQRQLAESGLFTQELIRLPELLDYYADSLQEKAAQDWDNYQRALVKISPTLSATEINSKQAILKCIFLAQLLGENFQATESFLAAALYDAYPDSGQAQQLSSDLLWLKAAEVCWKHDVTEQWTLAGDAGVNIEELITGKLSNFTGLSLESLFNKSPDIVADLLPPVGIHDLEPSACGIVRSYQVSLLSAPFTTSQIKLTNPLISAQVFLLLADNEEQAQQAKQQIAELQTAKVYFWLPLAGINAESVTIDGKFFKLNTLLCRYLALETLLKENTIGDELRRQLEAKWDKARQQLLNLLQIFYGRTGLETGKSQILIAGSLEPVVCQSWHGLRESIAEAIQQSYHKEIPVRARNLNTLRDESYLGRSIIQTMVKRILDFEENSSYQTDLLGNNETSEPAALIDGVLGANQLFIQRPDGWDLKKVAETDNGIKEVLTLIHDTLLRKRDKPYSVAELRTKLITPPYGIPACTLAIFAAVAIRHEKKRLRWYGSRESDFATNLNNAFAENSELSIRLIEFSNKQYAVLHAVGLYFKMARADQSPEEYGSECAARLRDFIKHQPDAVKTSSQLNDKTKALIRFLKEVAKSTQDLADFLLQLFELENKSHTDVTEIVFPLLKTCLDDFLRVSDWKKHEIQKTWQELLPSTETAKAELLARLSHQNANPKAKQLALLLESYDDMNTMAADEFSKLILRKSSNECSDIEIGECKAELRALINYHPPLPPPLPPTPVIKPMGDEFSKAGFIHFLQQQIKQTQLSNSEIREILQSLLQDYQD